MNKDLKEKFAFTLAEVLITLGIIGIVSAMTIPTLISNYQEKVTVTKLKKMFSTLSNAYQLYKVDNPAPQIFPITEEGAIQAFEVFKPYLKIAKDCGTKDGHGCVAKGNYKFLNGSTGTNYLTDWSYYKILLNDGASLVIRGGGSINKRLAIFYDVNGPSSPNTWGRDMFQFYTDRSNRLMPLGFNSPSEFELQCVKPTSIGNYCTGWVIQKENLDYLKCPDKLTWQDSKCPK